jgi:hypothetical protein
MGLNLKSEAVLDEILELPHLWPGEDRAIVDTVISNDGEYLQPITLGAMTVTDFSNSYPTMLRRLMMSSGTCGEQIQAAYLERGAPGSVPYVEPDPNGVFAPATK